MEPGTDPKSVLFEQFARVGRAVSNPKRLEMLDVLAPDLRKLSEDHS